MQEALEKAIRKLGLPGLHGVNANQHAKPLFRNPLRLEQKDLLDLASIIASTVVGDWVSSKKDDNPGVNVSTVLTPGELRVRRHERWRLKDAYLKPVGHRKEKQLPYLGAVGIGQPEVFADLPGKNPRKAILERQERVCAHPRTHHLKYTIKCLMPVRYSLELRLGIPTNNHSQTSTVGEQLHGFLHHQLGLAEPDIPHAERISTKTHNAQRQPVSIRVLTATRQRMTCQIILMHDAWKPVYDQALREHQKFGNGMALNGTIHKTHTLTWTLEQIRVQTHALEAPTNLEITFCSPTSFMHKKAAWDVPYPELVFRSLAARWIDFGGSPLSAEPDELVKHAVKSVWYRTQRGIIHAGREPLVGFKGQLRLILQGDALMRHDLLTLVTFGTMVNVGKRVAYGCGMVKAQARMGKAVMVDLGALLG